jgi:hypothetical protein
MAFPRRKLMLIFPPIPMPAWLFVTLYGLLELYLGITGSMLYVGKLDPKLEKLWEMSPGVNPANPDQDKAPPCVATDAAGFVFLGGSYSGSTIEFANGTLPPAMASGVLIAKLAP